MTHDDLPPVPILPVGVGSETAIAMHLGVLTGMIHGMRSDLASFRSDVNLRLDRFDIRLEDLEKRPTITPDEQDALSSYTKQQASDSDTELQIRRATAINRRSNWPAWCVGIFGGMGGLSAILQNVVIPLFHHHS